MFKELVKRGMTAPSHPNSDYSNSFGSFGFTKILLRNLRSVEKVSM
jgi:hypothetical protein